MLRAVDYIKIKMSYLNNVLMLQITGHSPFRFIVGPIYIYKMPSALNLGGLHNRFSLWPKWSYTQDQTSPPRGS